MRKLAALAFVLFSVRASAQCTCQSTISGAADFDNFATITGTLPSTITNNTFGVGVDMTSAGSSNHMQGASLSFLKPGYTGAATTVGVYGVNAAAGTGSSYFNGSTDTDHLGNVGLLGFSVSHSTGANLGVVGIADQSNGANGGQAIGSAGLCYANGVCVGAIGFANSGGPRVGVYAGLKANPTFVSTALLADNGSVAAPVFVARDNGATVLQIPDGGQLQLVTQGSKPTCSASTRGSFWYTAAANGTADSFEVCVKDAADFYAWVSAL